MRWWCVLKTPIVASCRVLHCRKLRGCSISCWSLWTSSSAGPMQVCELTCCTLWLETYRAVNKPLSCNCGLSWAPPVCEVEGSQQHGMLLPAGGFQDTACLPPRVSWPESDQHRQELGVLQDGRQNTHLPGQLPWFHMYKFVLTIWNTCMMPISYTPSCFASALISVDIFVQCCVFCHVKLFTRLPEAPTVLSNVRLHTICWRSWTQLLYNVCHPRFIDSYVIKVITRHSNNVVIAPDCVPGSFPKSAAHAISMSSKSINLAPADIKK